MDKKKFLVICDDLTGAGDIASWICNTNLNVKIINNFYECENVFDNSTDVLIFNTNSRIDDKETIKKKLSYLLSRTNSNFIFKKIDSTLRGNFVYEIDFLIHYFNLQILPFVAAYPEYGRFTIKGEHYIENTLLHKTYIGNDPKNPVKTSHILELIKEKSSFYNKYKIYDASTNYDFIEIIKNVISLNTNIYAGSSKFFKELIFSLLDIKNIQKKKITFDNIVIIGGSFNPITKKSLDYLYSYYNFNNIFKNSFFSINEYKNIISIESDRNKSEFYDIKDFVKKSINYNGLFILTGGETAYEFTKLFNISKIKIIEKLFNGIVLCKDEKKNIYFILKPGGFGNETIFIDIIKLLVKEK